MTRFYNQKSKKEAKLRRIEDVMQEEGVTMEHVDGRTFVNFEDGTCCRLKDIDSGEDVTCFPRNFDTEVLTLVED